MATKRKRSSGLRRLRLLAVLILVYCLVAVGYYFLPWSVRRHVYTGLPRLDRTLVRTGFRIVSEWDLLGLRGRDCSVALDRSMGADHAYGGYPSQGFKLLDRVKVLENLSYTAGYSESMRNPLWVAYRVFDVRNMDSGARPSRFKVDRRTEARVSHDDYLGSGYDRGHMAPNHAIATRYGRAGQRETFLMSNVIPQVPSINRHLWKDLEMLVSRKYGRYFGEVWVVTGPVFTKPVGKLDSGVSIPSGYYKIIADEDRGKLRVLAFLVEADLPPYSRIRPQLVSVDELEALTGLDFFPGLDDEAQEKIESRPAGRLWPWVIPAIRHAF